MTKKRKYKKKLDPLDKLFKLEDEYSAELNRITMKGNIAMAKTLLEVNKRLIRLNKVSIRKRRKKA